MLDTIKNFIDTIIEKLNLQCETIVTENDEEYNVQLVGPDASILIGYRGDVLDSIQYLTLLVINKNGDNKKRLVIDGDNYREKRSITLSKLAKSLAIQATKSGQPKALEPMNPFERRIIHSALANDKFVTTESEGEEPNRYVVIKPLREKRPTQNKQTTTPKKAEPVVPRNTSINRFASKMKSFGGSKNKYGF